MSGLDNAPECSDVDRLALARCLKIALRDPVHGENLRLLAQHNWLEAAMTASYNVQGDALRLHPWEDPPCCCDPSPGTPGGRLLAKMLAHGVSRYEPDPLGGLERAAKRKPRPK
jgi:hypothetical protein